MAGLPADRGTAAFGVVIRATLLPAPPAVVVGPEPPPDPTVNTPFMPWAWHLAEERIGAGLRGTSPCKSPRPCDVRGWHLEASNRLSSGGAWPDPTG